MQELAGYAITEKIHESARTIIYRGRRKSDETPVIVKVLDRAYPPLGELIRFKNQYTIAKNLDLPGIVKPLSLENYGHSFALILEEFGGESLKEYILSQKKLHLDEFLKIAIQIVGTLEQLHKNRIIHKDIKPHNILINPKSGIVKITDFSISSLLPREQANLSNPNSLEGTLAYLSPEQTGRMNRGIDYRADFYSLGATFYEMLTGELPFAIADPMELVHCHIAKQPVPPADIEEIPQALSDIVMKLMAKNAEDRYQSAKGLLADLKNCQNQLETKGRIELFILGQQDICDRFQIPEKLYGREKETETLMAGFERASGGTTEMMLVAGYSGIGKSALVREVHKPIVKARGYFISGKFDQFKRNIPFASLIQAFRDLVRQLLTESEARITLWKEKLAKALEANGQIIVDVIPEIEHLLGQQPPVAELGPTESQNRFNLVFQKFIRVFAQPEHPLVVFLDDLQWADSASLKLLQLLMSDPDTKYLFLIGAYRDNEVSSSHPTMLTLENIQKAGTTVNWIILQPLATENLNRLIADALSCPEERALPLTELVHSKTQGNPFFATQFLKSLYEEGLLQYDLNRGHWQCDIAKVKAIAVSDNVVEFMAIQLGKLPAHTREVLKLAACIGHQFDLETLSVVCEKSQTETAADLWKALQEGLVLPVSDVYKFFQDEEKSEIGYSEWRRGNDALFPMPNSQSPTYKFLHDRVQQAAYFLIPEAEKKATHLQIGQLLLKNTRAAELEEKIFELVNQLNVGAELIDSQEEKNKLAQLNLIGGRKAKSATAYEPAVRYLNFGLGLLAADSWTHEYKLTHALHVEASEAEYLNINFERAKQLSRQVLERAKDVLDTVKVYELQIQYYVGQNQPIEAIATAGEILEKLGISLPAEKQDISDRAAYLKEKITASVAQIEDLAKLPPMTEPSKLAAMRILMNALAPAYQTNAELLQLVACTMIDLSMQYGNAPQTIPGYGYYGVILCGVYNDLESGYKFGQLTVKVWEQFNVPELKVKAINLFNGFVRYWKDHVRETLEPLQDSVHSGLETGDLEYAFYDAVHHGNHLFFIGEPLESLNRTVSQYLEMMEKLKLELHIGWQKIWKQRILNLLGQAADPCQLVGESFDEAEIVPIWVEKNIPFLLFCFYCCKTMLLYLFKNTAGAVEASQIGEKYEQAGTGLIYATEFNFYSSLALLAACGDADRPQKEQYLEKVAANQERMKFWAAHAPVNFQHKYELVEAERTRIVGDVLGAMTRYDRAIALAKENDYLQEEALGNELAAEFYLAAGHEKIAQMYLTEAYYGYIRWGAIAKVRALETSYPQFLARINSPKNADSFSIIATISAAASQVSNSTTTGNASVLDLGTVMKASFALSEEIRLDKLLANLMRVILENAGAQKGFIVLEKEGQLVVEASGSIDSDEVTVLRSLPVAEEPDIPAAIIYYADRTGETLVLDRGDRESIFASDPYIARVKPKSILCLPIVHKGKRLGLLYLENNLSAGVFTADRLEVLKLLSSQAAISLENALLYQNLQATNEALQRSESQLQSHADRLEKSLHELQQAQLQLIQSEKLSSLGQLVAGVAHEINNPVNFIQGNMTHMSQYIQDILHHLRLYRKHYPEPVLEIQDDAETIELEYVVEDLPKMLSSMRMGTERISEIVRSLKNFSRKDAGSKQAVDIHQGIDSTLLILNHRLKANGSNPGIKVIKEYDNLPLVDCYPGQLNQVFMNLLANAIDALEEKSVECGVWSVECKETSTTQNLPASTQHSPTIWIRTEVVNRNCVTVRIKDNGPGMTEEVRSRIFETFFTTKPEGKGTGMGLSISYQIVVEKHGGELSCTSAPGEGTEFAIAIPIR